MKKNLLFTLPFACLLSIHPVFSQTPTPTPAKIQYTYDQLKEDLARFIKGQMDKEHIKGLSLALVDGSNVIWTKGFGWADADKQIPATEDTRYALGGLSRIFTATEVLRLSETGKVNLDQSIRSYIPGFSIHSRFKHAKPITLRALLSGHSGLPGFFVKGIWVDEPESLADWVKDLKADYLNDIPQSRYCYSYTDYDLLGRLVELKRNKPFPETMEKDLFEPLGMESSAFETPEPADDTAVGYMNGKPFAQGRLRDIPAGGMVSSASDLAKFLSFLLGAKPLGKAPINDSSIEALFTEQFPDKPLDFNHQVGMGWNLSGFPIGEAGEAAWCDGTYPGYFAETLVLKEEGLAVAVLSNSSEAGKVGDNLVERVLKLALQVKQGTQQDLEKKKIEMPKTVQVPVEKMGSYAGIYSVLGQLTQIKAEEKKLTAEYQGNQLDLLPISQDTFVPHFTFFIFPVDLPQYPLTFSKVAGMDLALLGGLHYPIPLKKLTPADIPDAWKEREGDYEMENPDGTFQLSGVSLGEKDGFLEVQMKVSLKAFDVKEAKFKTALLPLSDEDAVVPGLFYGDGGTLHATEDGEGGTHIFYSGYWFKLKKNALASPTPTIVQATPKP